MMIVWIVRDLRLLRMLNFGHARWVDMVRFALGRGGMSFISDSRFHSQHTRPHLATRAHPLQFIMRQALWALEGEGLARAGVVAPHIAGNVVLVVADLAVDGLVQLLDEASFDAPIKAGRPLLHDIIFDEPYNTGLEPQHTSTFQACC